MAVNRNNNNDSSKVISGLEAEIGKGFYILSNPDSPKEFIYVMPKNYVEEKSFNDYKELQKEKYG